MRRSRNVRIDAGQVHAHARTWVDYVLKLEDHGHKCTAERVISILLVAASRVCSIAAACRDLADAPSDQALRDALYASLPGIDRLEKQINQTLAWGLPARVRRHRRVIAGDLILIPYYGEPDCDASELYHSKQKAGTTKFHGYATACVIHEGMRYTVALTRVEKGEKMPAIVKRLVRQVRAAGLKFKVFLLDRGFFTLDVITYLKRARVPFLMPVAIRGIKAKNKTRRRAGLRGFQVKSTGWYEYTFQGRNRQRIHVCVCAKYRHHRKENRRKLHRYQYGAWNFKASPCAVRELYRKRFGIETSYRQAHESRIRTCSRKPQLRLLFFGLSLILRNVWVWLHFTVFAASRGEYPQLRLHRLRYRRMLHWIASVITANLHNGSLPESQWLPGT